VADKTTKKKSEAFKDRIDRAAVTRLADEMSKVHRRFDRTGFVAAVCDDDFFKLELMDRIRSIAARLRPFLPKDYAKAVGILIKVAQNGSGFNWALTGYVEQFGLDDFEVSVAALAELTKYGSSEFAIRPYMIRYTDRMMPILHEWALDDNEHVRRLAAEGSRPRGVWVAHIDAFKRDPRPVLKLLDKLKADPSKYVQKAVANNLNDISRDNPDAAIKTAVKWYKSDNSHTRWIVKHACRSLIKQGRPEVFPLFGFTSKPRLKLSDLKVKPRKVKIGDELVFSFALVSQAKTDQRLAIDYRVYFRLANGKLSPKVFKLSEKSLPGSESITLSKKHSFKPATTRKLYPGRHEIEIMINGEVAGKVSFDLVA
jgi:3-methyladenine DNA glycosylase AlkC